MLSVRPILTSQYIVFFISSDVQRHSATLMTYYFLLAGAVRFLRRLINLKDDTYSRHIVQNSHFKAVCEAFLANGDKYNLFNSAIIEMFEFIRTVS